MYTSERTQLIYPEKKLITHAQAIIWAHDCFDNGETEEWAEDLESALRILEDLGHITVARGK